MRLRRLGFRNGVRPPSCLTFKVDASCLITAPYCSVYGITVIQASIYFRNSGQDSVNMKSFVSKPIGDQ